MILIASSKLPSWTFLMKAGMSISTGQPSMQTFRFGPRLHWRHLCASAIAVWASWPIGTSLKLWILSLASCSGIGYFFGTSFLGFFSSSAILRRPLESLQGDLLLGDVPLVP